MTKVVNIRSGEKYDVYCGRAGHGQDGYFGNPHIIGHCNLMQCLCVHDRTSAIAAFRKDFEFRIHHDSGFFLRVLEIKDKILGCFCKPLPCHCDIIADYLNSHDELGKTLPNNRVVIAGSRIIEDYDIVESAVKDSGFKIDEVVCGCARGVDNLGKMWADMNDIPVKRFPAKWDDLTVSPCSIKIKYNGAKYNSWAGHIRNKEMAKYGTHLILVWDGKSSGSASMKKLANDYNLKIYEKIV